jgi:hypothetical protein
LQQITEAEKEYRHRSHGDDHPPFPEDGDSDEGYKGEEAEPPEYRADVTGDGRQVFDALRAYRMKPFLINARPPRAFPTPDARRKGGRR